MAVWAINPYLPVDTIKKEFLAWEQMLDARAPTYKLFNIGSPVNTLEYETALQNETVYSGAIGTVAWNATDTTWLSISAALAGIITNYAVLKIENEMVAVKSVNRIANTIEVFARWMGSTTGATHTAWLTANVLSFNMPKGVKDIEANFLEQSLDTNVVWKYTVPSLKFTKEDVNIQRAKYGEAWYENFIASQILAKDKSLIETVNKALIYGTKEVGSDTMPSMTRWLLEEASLKGNVVTSFGTISSLSKIDDALTSSRNKQWEANVLLCWPSAFDAIQKLWVVENQKPQILNRLEVELGTRVVSVFTKVWTLYLVMDLDMPIDTIVVLNNSDLSIHPLVGYTTPWGNKTTAQESTRNDEAFVYDTISQFGTYFRNSNKNLTIISGITY